MDVWNVAETEGNMLEGTICCSSYNTGFFEAAVSMGDINAIYCGHDHNNDYQGVLEGITLGYGRKTGLGSYGPAEGVANGARIIQLNQNDPTR